MEHFHYPILSILARDVLTICISTVASESAFSIGGRLWRKRMLLWKALLKIFSNLLVC
ncbi:unnamed protein product [Prunus armeniaca]